MEHKEIADFMKKDIARLEKRIEQDILERIKFTEALLNWMENPYPLPVIENETKAHP